MTDLGPSYQEWLQFKKDTDPEFKKWKQQKDADATCLRAEQERNRREAERKRDNDSRAAIFAVDLGLSVKWASCNLGATTRFRDCSCSSS